MKYDDVTTILRALNDAQARYLIVGGLAVVAHGYVRATFDVDVVLQLEPGNITRAFESLSKVGYEPLVPVDAAQFGDEAIRQRWREEKNMIVFQFRNPDRDSTRLDIFVEEPFDFEKEYAEADRLDVAGIPSPVLRLETLLEMKRQANRNKDKGDVGELEKILQIRRDDAADD